jgi:hypothetical protein
MNKQKVDHIANIAHQHNLGYQTVQLVIDCFAGQATPQMFNFMTNELGEGPWLISEMIVAAKGIEDINIFLEV